LKGFRNPCDGVELDTVSHGNVVFKVIESVPNIGALDRHGSDTKVSGGKKSSKHEFILRELVRKIKVNDRFGVTYSHSRDAHAESVQVLTTPRPRIWNQ
jgi:hypothetical protein